MDLLKTDRTLKQLETTFEEHASIIDNLRKRDSQGSAKAMKVHMDSVYKEMILLDTLLNSEKE